MIHSRSTKYLNFGQQLHFGHNPNLLENRHPEDTKYPYCIVPCGESKKVCANVSSWIIQFSWGDNFPGFAVLLKVLKKVFYSPGKLKSHLNTFLSDNWQKLIYKLRAPLNIGPIVHFFEKKGTDIFSQKGTASNCWTHKRSRFESGLICWLWIPII